MRRAVDGTRAHARPFSFAWLTIWETRESIAGGDAAGTGHGVYGLSFVFAMIGCAVALIVMRRPRRELAWVLILPLIYFVASTIDDARDASGLWSYMRQYRYGDLVDSTIAPANRITARVSLAHAQRRSHYLAGSSGAPVSERSVVPSLCRADRGVFADLFFCPAQLAVRNRMRRSTRR